MLRLVIFQINMRFIKLVILIFMAAGFLCSDIAFCNEEALFLLRQPLLSIRTAKQDNITFARMRKDSEIIIRDRITDMLMSVLGYCSLVKDRFKGSERIQNLSANISDNMINLFLEQGSIVDFLKYIEEKVLDIAELIAKESENLFTEEPNGILKERIKAITLEFNIKIDNIKSNILKWSSETDANNIDQVVKLYLDTLASAGLKENISFSPMTQKGNLIFNKDIRYEALILMNILDNLLIYGTKMQGISPYDKNVSIKTSLYDKKWVRIEIFDPNRFSQKFYDLLQEENWLTKSLEDAELKRFLMIFRYIELKGGRFKIEAETEENKQVLFEARFDKGAPEIKQTIPKSRKFSGSHFTIYIPVEENTLEINKNNIGSAI